jgi:hypothetical protein
METIPYRRSKLLIKTIPKGTLLFRLVKDQLSDVRGVSINETTRCITPNFNVYFHPNPFIGHHMYKEYLNEIGDTVHIYTLKEDVKVLLLVEPSKHSRLDYKKKGMFLKPCSTVRRGCMPKKGKEYDACLSDTIIKKFPNVVGMIAVSAGDAKYLRKALKRGIRNKTLKTFHKAKDSSNIEGVPELILHPLTKRPSEDVLVKDDTELDNNYKLLKKIPYNEDKLHQFMDAHATYDDETKFFTYKE